jgi:hypothetical protein
MRIVREGIEVDTMREVVQRAFNESHIIPGVIPSKSHECGAKKAVIRYRNPDIKT